MASEYKNPLFTSANRGGAARSCRTLPHHDRIPRQGVVGFVTLPGLVVVVRDGADHSPSITMSSNHAVPVVPLPA
ncbi:MAG: hypothetical protein AABZ07_02800, partial [Nitrospirota bacterium]